MPRFATLTMLVLMCCAVLFLAACAVCNKTADGPTVKLVEPGKIREVPAACFDEKNHAARGWIKNTDARGQVIYVRIPDTDRKKDTTFLSGPGTGKERSFGGYDGQFTGRPRVW